MGMYNTVWFTDSRDEEIYIQVKHIGESCMLNMTIGDLIDAQDGIHFGYEGAFVVKDSRIVCAFSKEEIFLIDKWGGEIPFPELKR